MKKEVNSKETKNKENQKKLNIYLMINSILLALVALTAIIILAKYNVLPFKYMLTIIFGLITIPCLLIFLMMKPNIKIKIKKISSGVSTFFIIILAILIFLLNKTFKFLNNLVDDGYIIENYSVIVLSNDKYNELEDIKEKTLGYYSPEVTHTQEALDILDDKISTDKQEYEDYGTLTSSLYNEDIDAMIMEESYRAIIEETNEKFSEETKVIYTIEVKVKSENTVKNVDVSKDTFNIYISGIDTYGKISSVSRSDVNIIATVNPTTNQILLTTIPRDYYVQLDGTTGYKDKLTHAGIYGIDKSIKTLENLLDIEINYYVKVNFSSVEKIVDVLGGVEVYSEYTFTGHNGTKYSHGYNKVNGKQALEFARTRKTVTGGDRTRGQNQQALIQAMLNKTMSKEIITKYTSVLSSLEGTFQTNIPTDKITELVKKQIDTMASWTLTSIGLDGSDGSEYTYSYSGQKLYVMIPNEETIENAKQKIKEVTNGAILEESYQQNTGSVTTLTQTPVQQETQQQEVTQPTSKPTIESQSTETPQQNPTTQKTNEEDPTPQTQPEPTPEAKEDEKIEPDEPENNQTTNPETPNDVTTTETPDQTDATTSEIDELTPEE